MGCSSCAGQAVDKIKSETTQMGTIEYDYDSLAQRIAMRVPGSPQVDYSYDKVGQLNAITRLLGGVEKTFNLK